MGKVIGLISIKGGVGKTTAVINIAHSLASCYGKKVLVIDANFSCPNLNLYLGNTNPKHTVRDVLNSRVKAGSAVYEHEYGFHVLPSSFNVTNGNNFLGLKARVQNFKKYYDFIILDSSPSLSNELLAAIAASDELYAVSTPDLPTLSTTLKAVKVARDKKMNISGLILNKVRGKNYELKPDDMERLSGIPLFGVIKDDVMIPDSVARVKPVTLLSHDSDISEAFRKIAAKIAGVEYEEPRWHRKLFANIKNDFSRLSAHKFSRGLLYYK